MFVTFSTDAYENISYFGDVAKRLIILMGHSGTIPGAIKAHDLPEALKSLQVGIGQERILSSSNSDEEEPAISLKNRAIPLMNMLESAIKKDCDILWDTAKSPG